MSNEGLMVNQLTDFVIVPGRSFLGRSATGDATVEMTLQCWICKATTRVFPKVIEEAAPRIDTTNRICNVSVRFEENYGNCRNCTRKFNKELKGVAK
jgi:hypothetical protein